MAMEFVRSDDVYRQLRIKFFFGLYYIDGGDLPSPILAVFDGPLARKGRVIVER